MSFPKGLTCFLEMDLCYVILNISCCLLLCHNSKIPIKNENILNLKKSTLYLYWKTYGSGRRCFSAMETSVLHQVYLNSWQLSNFQWCKRGSLYKVPNLNVFTHVLYQHHMLNEQQVLLPTFIIGKMSTLFSKNNQFKIAYKAILCPWDSPYKNTGVGCHAPPPRGSSQPRD